MTKQERIATDTKRKAHLAERWFKAIEAGKPFRGFTRAKRRYDTGKRWQPVVAKGRR